MNLFNVFSARVKDAVQALVAKGELPAAPSLDRVVVEPPREAAHGDLATNAALVLAKETGRKPRDLAQAIAGELGRDPDLASVEVAGPGFINM